VQPILTLRNNLVTFIYIKLLSEENAMYTTTQDGLLNNYAAEPPVYYAEFPSPEQQQRFALQGAIASLFVMVLVLTAFAA
jgi:hypothetical protein